MNQSVWHIESDVLIATYPAAWRHRMPMSTLIVLERAATMHPNVHTEIETRYTTYTCVEIGGLRTLLRVPTFRP